MFIAKGCAMRTAGTGSRDRAVGIRVLRVYAGLLGCTLGGLALAQNADSKAILEEAVEAGQLTGQTPATSIAPAKADEVTFRGKAVCTAGGRVAGVKVSITGKSFNPDAEETWTATTAADGSFSMKAKAKLVQSANISVEPPAGTKFAPTAVLPRQMTTMLRAGDPPEITIVLAPANSKITGMSALRSDRSRRPRRRRWTSPSPARRRCSPQCPRTSFRSWD